MSILIFSKYICACFNMHFKKNVIGIFLFFFFTVAAHTQTLHSPDIYSNHDTLQAKFYQKGNKFHPSVRPYYAEEINTFFTTVDNEKDSTKKTKFLSIRAYPLFGLYSGVDLDDKSLIKEFSAGANVTGNISNKVSFQSTYIYSYAGFPEYADSLISLRHTAPNHGFAHPHGTDYSFNDFRFYANYKASDHFLFEGGFGKNFFGDGYRSLFLSENASSYPYFKIVTTAWRIKYTNLYTQFNDITEGYYGWNKSNKKYGSFQFLSWNVSKRLNLNFFEGIVWSAKTKNNTRGFDINYLNPVIFLRPIEFTLGSPDNALLGFGFHYKAFKSTVIYGQLLLDEFLLSEVRSGFSHLIHPNDSNIQYGSWFNKQAIQLGFKVFDLAGVKNLQFTQEMNYVRPYTYSHREVAENYGHFNQALAHPYGANFIEFISLFKYTKNKFSFDLHFSSTLIGLDSGNTHYGQDIYKSTYDTYMPDVDNIIVMQHGNKVGQGLKTHITYGSFKVNYLAVKKLNMRIEAGIAVRNFSNSNGKQNSMCIFGGINIGIPSTVNDY